MSYVLDGKGNIYDAETGRRIWSGDPQDVVVLLEERNELAREILSQQKRHRWETNKQSEILQQLRHERDKACAEVERIRSIAFRIADIGMTAAFEREAMRREGCE